MEISYEEVSHEAKVPKLGPEPLEVTAGHRDIELAEAEADDDADNSWVEGGLPAIAVAHVVEGEDADAAVVAYAAVEEQTDHAASVVEDLVDTVMALFYPRHALRHTLWELERFHTVVLMSVFDLAAARLVAVNVQRAWSSPWED